MREQIRAHAHRVAIAVRDSWPWHRWMYELTRQDRKGVRRYAIGIVWAITFLVFTPRSFSFDLNTALRVAVLVGAGLGGVAAIVGRVTFRHLSWELPGVLALTSGLAFYAVVQGTLAMLDAQQGNTDRIALTVLAVWITAEVSDRLEVLTRIWWQRLTDPEEPAK